MRTIVPSRLLKAVLVADAAGTGGIALLQLGAAPPIAQATLLPDALLVESGAFLLAFTALLAVLALAPALWRAVVQLVVAGNVGWALGCVALLAGGVIAPNALGAAFVGVHIASVLLFAALEFAGLERSMPVGTAALVR